ncbi:MAG TPA: c-type cytochrome [Pyrinomonadaceae bacterium]|nr:c-type cytochrome [Pyrinomonadaceae bacterium]
MKKQFGILILIAWSIVVVSCKREERGFRVQPPAARASNSQTLSDLQPGATSPAGEVKNDYEQNAYALSEGQRLFSAYNCSGCHSHGGGGMGPPLMDEKWIYGGKPDQIFSTIVEGRPNGMPSFRHKIPDFQVWQLAAYVRSMSGQTPKDASPSREDHLKGKEPEGSMPKQPIKNSKQ